VDWQWICCATSSRTRRKLWICCTTCFRAYSSNSTSSISCGLAVDLLWICCTTCCTTNRASGVRASAAARHAQHQPNMLCRYRTSSTRSFNVDSMSPWARMLLIWFHRSRQRKYIVQLSTRFKDVYGPKKNCECKWIRWMQINTHLFSSRLSLYMPNNQLPQYENMNEGLHAVEWSAMYIGNDRCKI
jgi:hypothetical protein